MIFCHLQPDFSGSSDDVVVVKAERPFEPTINPVRQGRNRSMLTNPQLMGQDVQVKQYDISKKQRALQHITAKQ